MFLSQLAALHNVTTLMFGVYMSAFFLGIKQNRKNIIILTAFCAFLGILHAIGILLSGEITSFQLYPFITHLPLVLFLVLYYKYPLTASCVSVFSAYLCCQISNWVGLFVLSLTDLMECYYIARIITTTAVLFLLCRFVCRTTESVFAKNRRELFLFGTLPFLYYVFDYVATKFTDLLYSGSRVATEFTGFVYCISYLLFLLVYFREYENRQKTLQYGELMEMQLHSIQNETRQMKQNQEKLVILRHDMRHHLNLILTQLKNGNTDAAISYIQDISGAYDETVITPYCKNDMLNSVISIYQMRFSDRGFSLTCSISVGKSLPGPEVSFCTILSNALENAMHALETLKTEDKWAKLIISSKDSHLLLSLENPVEEIPVFVDGIPVSGKAGHGIGIKSMVYYVEKLNGQCNFSVTGHRFVLRIII